MLPQWHIILGILFTLVLWLMAPQTPLLYLALVLFASIFIDVDHYACAVFNTGKLGLVRAFTYHKEQGKKHAIEHARGIRKKGDFHILHTIESHALVGILGVFLSPFFYIFIGMVFHSLWDVLYMMKKDVLYRREYFLINWIRNK